MKIWLQACRVNSLAISSIGVMVGTVVALWYGRFYLTGFFLAWLGSVMIQAGTNLTNVYYNYKAASASNDPAAYDPRGSSAVIRKGLLPPDSVRNGGLFCFAVGILCGLVLVKLCGATILWLGLPAIAAGYFYAGPPIRYGYVALGVVSVFLFMGPVMVCGAFYVSALSFSWSSLAAAIPIGLVAAGIMHTNDLRDYDTDILHGKKTLATMLGRRGACYLLLGMDAAAFAVIIVAALARVLPWGALLVVLAIPQAIRQLRMVFGELSAAVLHQVWLRGVQLHTQFGAALMIGILFSPRHP
ncbi:MAG TPA: 1,4-dihydroxy-2-naphthoate octaprenyltransferase, partial [Bryobacteraceae bacterium]|nr:1,4-dihydroxy-2-naphthoate octaprenyltransferase [Bryobacteraceae bacterium]